MSCIYCDEGVPMICQSCRGQTYVRDGIAFHRGTRKRYPHAVRPAHRIPDLSGVAEPMILSCPDVAGTE